MPSDKGNMKHQENLLRKVGFEDVPEQNTGRFNRTCRARCKAEGNGFWNRKGTLWAGTRMG